MKLLMNRLIFYCPIVFLLLFSYSVMAQDLEIEDGVSQSGYVNHAQIQQGNTQKSNFHALPSGYRAMIEMGGGVWVWNRGCIGATTTHGYQFNQCVFLGGTIGFFHVFDEGMLPLACTLDFRAYFGRNQRHKPWVGITFGYPTADVSFGMRFALNKRNAINVALHVGVSGQMKFGFEF